MSSSQPAKDFINLWLLFCVLRSGKYLCESAAAKPAGRYRKTQRREGRAFDVIDQAVKDSARAALRRLAEDPTPQHPFTVVPKDPTQRQKSRTSCSAPSRTPSKRGSRRNWWYWCSTSPLQLHLSAVQQLGSAAVRCSSAVQPCRSLAAHLSSPCSTS